MRKNVVNFALSFTACRNVLLLHNWQQRWKWVSGLWVTASDPLTYDEITCRAILENTILAYDIHVTVVQRK